jgi:ATP-dependent helicase/nuclease subunit B
MEHETSHVLTCDPQTDLLAVLADQVRTGQLIPDARDQPLFRWRIFLPTRRAVRRLEQLFVDRNGGNPLALPVIKPIGDIDEDANNASHRVPDAISSHGLLFEVMALLADWAERNPQFAIARDVAGSMTRIQHLAGSLVELLHQAETEERPLDGIDAVYDLDLAGHREAILDLLGVLKTALPQRLSEQNLIGPSDRRNRLIRLQAADIRQRPGLAPIIIAGSTGTNPATRDLMAAIAHDPLGRVILPGLDKGLGDADWLTLVPTHPQYNLRVLMQELDVPRSAVAEIGGSQMRQWLAREIMRPSLTAEPWHASLHGKSGKMQTALGGVSLIEAPDRHIEARSIALVLFHAVHQGHKSIALITPDRDLAIRVKSELRRWAITADDTRGEPLNASGRAQLLKLLADLVLSGFSSRALVAVLHHRLARFGMEVADYQRAKQLFEIHVLRQQGLARTNEDSDGLSAAFKRATLARTTSSHDRVNDEAWQLISTLIIRMQTAFAEIQSAVLASLGDHIRALRLCLELVAGDVEPVQGEMALETALQDIAAEQHRLPNLLLSDVLALLLAKLKSVTVRPVRQDSPIAIYGLLEARLMSCDVAVLGGLNETVWPASPDPGPWLNRPMRDAFGMQQPERDIGLTAHDFVSGLGHRQVYLTWSKRIGTEPAIPSRWVLRLRAVMAAGGIDTDQHCDPTYVQHATALDRASQFKPCDKPWPRPPVHTRPRRFSVTEIERLVRDPYSIYARRMLRLRSLDPVGQELDARLRGTLIHAALKHWNQQSPFGATPAPLTALIAAGTQAFETLNDDPDVAAFWWPGFLRMATWLSDQEKTYRADLAALHAETPGRTELTMAGEIFEITAIADRIDVLADGSARLIDYKTGQIPTPGQIKSGFSPQLTLEAAMLAAGGFSQAGKRRTSAAHYVRISAGRESGKILAIDSGDFDIGEIASRHWAGLQQRLATLLLPGTAFPPRVKLQFETRGSDDDHLSRFQEWSLAR